MAQSVERHIGNVEVTSSILVSSFFLLPERLGYRKPDGTKPPGFFFASVVELHPYASDSLRLVKPAAVVLNWDAADSRAVRLPGLEFGQPAAECRKGVQKRWNQTERGTADGIRSRPGFRPSGRKSRETIRRKRFLLTISRVTGWNTAISGIILLRTTTLLS